MKMLFDMGVVESALHLDEQMVQAFLLFHIESSNGWHLRKQLMQIVEML